MQHMCWIAVAWIITGSLAGACLGQSVDDVLRRSFAGEIGDGSLASSAKALEDLLAASPQNDQALAALGVVRFLQSGEGLLQRMYRYGGFNLPVQASMLTGMGGVGQNIGYNGDPQPISYEDFRAAIEQWLADVAGAETALAAVREAELKVRIPIGLARMDLDGDGQSTEREQLWKLFAAVQQRFTPNQEDVDRFEIAFDRGDVAWLRGYCHLCMAFGEFVLAHDSREAFERAGHLLFARNVTPYEYLKGSRRPFDFEGVDASDVVAFVHCLSFELAEPERMERARQHLLQTFALANEMWEWYDAETDDDREWIPNVSQRETAIPDALITREMHDVWIRALAEGEALLRGEKLLRFWRGDGERGVNVRRFFAEPRRFDLVLWVQGSGAAPYLEEGEFTSEGLWRDLEQAFERGTFRYIWWMN
ncbi:MAG TPA: hypothetical protein VFF69_13240 [Phycisphaerales bacterium]|nr:hypothetical protein [Phycisphaerales bacterium]